MKIKILLLQLFFFIIVFVSCKEHKYDFYSYDRVDDLSRMPLLKPYELLNQWKADSNYEGTHGWSLRFRYNVFDGSINHLNISNINVSKGIIFGHGQDGKTNFPNYWVVIIPGKKYEQVFRNSQQWKNAVDSLGLNSNKLYPVWPLFGQFETDLILPWYNSKKNIFPE